MQILPPRQSINPPDEQTILDAQKKDILQYCYVARPAIITAYDPGEIGVRSPTVSARIAQKFVAGVTSTGADVLLDYPLLEMVPVVFPSGGGFSFTWPIVPGDECLLVFCDREIDGWQVSGDGQPPKTVNMHDISDAIAIVGIRNNKRAVAASPNTMQLKSNNGQTFVELGAGKIQLVADEIVIHARNKLSEDAGGTGTVTTPGQIDTYTTGVPVTPHSPNPPGPL